MVTFPLRHHPAEVCFALLNQSLELCMIMSGLSATAGPCIHVVKLLTSGSCPVCKPFGTSS